VCIRVRTYAQAANYSTYGATASCRPPDNKPVAPGRALLIVSVIPNLSSYNFRLPTVQTVKQPFANRPRSTRGFLISHDVRSFSCRSFIGAPRLRSRQGKIAEREGEGCSRVCDILKWRGFRGIPLGILELRALENLKYPSTRAM